MVSGYKIINSTHNHKGFTYVEGLNTDNKKFDYRPDKDGGGLHFFEDVNDIFQYLCYGVFLYSVEVPRASAWVRTDKPGVLRSKSIVISNKLDLREPKSWRSLEKLGLKTSNYMLLLWACKRDYDELTEYLIKKGVDFHSCEEAPLRLAVSQNSIKVVRVLTKYGAQYDKSIAHLNF